MKRLIALCLLSLFATACWPALAEQERRNEAVDRSFRCMWAGDCN